MRDVSPVKNDSKRVIMFLRRVEENQISDARSISKNVDRESMMEGKLTDEEITSVSSA